MSKHAKTMRVKMPRKRIVRFVTQQPTQHHPQPSQQQPATKATSGGMDGLTAFLIALIGMLAAWGILS